MGSKSERKLRNLFVNRDVQFRILMISLVYMFCIVVVMLIVTLFPSVLDMYYSTDMNVKYKAAQMFLTLAKRLIPLMIVLFTLFFVHILYVTHRVCGPLVNFTASFERLASCDFSRKVVIRKGDYLKKECDKINDVIEGVAGQMLRIKTSHHQLVSELEEVLEMVTDTVAREKIEKILSDAKSDVRGLGHELDLFIIDQNETEGKKQQRLKMPKGGPASLNR